MYSRYGHAFSVRVVVGALLNNEGRQYVYKTGLVG